MNVFRRFLFSSLASATLVLLMAGTVRAQESMPASAQSDNIQSANAQFADAEEAYQWANYDRAIELFSKVAQNPDVAKEKRRNSLQYLSRAYVAKDMSEKAKQAIKQLVELEPPIIELDPMVEPPPVMEIYYGVRKSSTGSYAISAPDPGINTLAIMDFTNSSVDDHERFDPLNKGFASMMSHYLQGATDLKIVERERIQWLLNELELQREGGTVDPSTAVRTGKLLGAQSVVFGAYSVHGDRLWISARLVKVETGEILLAEQIFGDKDEFFSLIEELSLKTTRAINVSLEETELGGRTETKSLDAMLAYSDGLALLEQDKYREAYEKFLLAQEYDPSYKRAEIKALSLRPLLALNETEAGPDQDPEG